MNDAATGVMSPIIQYGFAGFSIILLGILIWLIRELLKVLKENNEVIAKNTQAIIAVDTHAQETLDVAIECKDALLQRPCIAGKT